ncbi:MAG: hypothetical protein ABSG25_04160 [Bryobacteraceae bacterium]
MNELRKGKEVIYLLDKKYIDAILTDIEFDSRGNEVYTIKYTLNDIIFTKKITDRSEIIAKI